MVDYHSQFYPKPRTGKECKKVKCARYKNYITWSFGSAGLEFCMACSHAHISQYKRGNT